MKSKVLILAASLLIGKVTAEFLTPHKYAAYFNEEFSLEEIVPETFGDWSVDNNTGFVQPLEQSTLSDLIYDQTIYRGYRNHKGDLIMLVLAYGQRQSDRLQLHQPDVCYSANGFSIQFLRESALSLPSVTDRIIPTNQMYANFRSRYEPVTYWSRIGDTITAGKLDRQWTKITYGLTGYIPDGILVRVSSISNNPEEAFALHQSFLNEMIGAVPDPYIKLFIGTK
ncbi:hypothetical protein GCM10017044_20410 [Kordiimonas sediminis]|uniref:Methanolan biosynthesis EpsI domain-containing protein n=1 Tax=Kordiimonas sediminis TaxID=1735581 RepID=A0A919ATY1_9PROT|nr:exosortase-associated protein EpsI, V-type [Kordiimonas sediminis]GHF25520.1 hypothetical protein GCM10017044_20410 [Kordiimonas sediminis]